MSKRNWHEFLKEHNICREGLEYIAKYKSFRAAFKNCNNVYWLAWLGDEFISNFRDSRYHMGYVQGMKDNSTQTKQGYADTFRLVFGTYIITALIETHLDIDWGEEYASEELYSETS